MLVFFNYVDLYDKLKPYDIADCIDGVVTKIRWRMISFRGPQLQLWCEDEKDSCKLVNLNSVSLFKITEPKIN